MVLTMQATPPQVRRKALSGGLAALLAATLILGACNRADGQSGDGISLQENQATSEVDEVMLLIRRAHAIMDEVQERGATIVGDQPCGLLREAMTAASRDTAYSAVERDEIGSVSSVVCDSGSTSQRRHDALHGLESYLKTGQGS